MVVWVRLGETVRYISGPDRHLQSHNTSIAEGEGVGSPSEELHPEDSLAKAVGSKWKQLAPRDIFLHKDIEFLTHVANSPKYVEVDSSAQVTEPAFGLWINR